MLGAAFDARLEGEIDAAEAGSKGRPSIDELLVRVGLVELAAARQELALLSVPEREQAAGRAALARLYAGPLGSPERAIEAWVEVLALEPGSSEARDALIGEHGATGDAAPLVSALLRVATQGRPERLPALRDLAQLGATRLGLPGLALWAGRAALEMEPDAELAELVARVEPAAREEEARIAELSRELESGGDRAALLAELAGLLRSRPDRSEQYLETLASLLELPGEHRPWQRSLERVLVREGRGDELLAALERALARGPGADHERLALSLAVRRFARGDEAGALRPLEPLVEAPASHPAACAMAVVLACRRREERTWAHALMRLSAPASSAERAVLLAAAAEALLAAGEGDDGD